MKTKTKIHLYSHFRFCLHFVSHFCFCFCFCYRFYFYFYFCFDFRFCFCFCLDFRFAFVFLFFFVCLFLFCFQFSFLNFTMAPLGRYRPPSLNLIIPVKVESFHLLFYFISFFLFFQKLNINNFLFLLTFRSICLEVFLSQRSRYLEFCGNQMFWEFLKI